MADVKPVEEAGDIMENDAPDSGGQNEPITTDTIAWRKWCIGAGVLMMLLALVLSALIPVQSEVLYISNRAFMAVGGGLVAGGILGFLMVDLPLGPRQGIRAGGGFAVFVILFLVNPPALTASATAPATRRDELDRIVKLASDAGVPAGGDSRAARRRLQQVLKQEGFGSVSEFRVTASTEDIQRVERRIRDVR